MWKRRNNDDIEQRLRNVELALKALAMLVSEEIVRHDELSQQFNNSMSRG